MPAGASLPNGIYKSGPLSDDEMWSAFAYLFSPKAKHAASYKYGFLKAILDNLYNTDDNLVLTFDQLFSKFAEIYWNLVLKHHIKQNVPGVGGKTTKLEQSRTAIGIPFIYKLTNTNLIIVYCQAEYGYEEKCHFT